MFLLFTSVFVYTNKYIALCISKFLLLYSILFGFEKIIDFLLIDRPGHSVPKAILVTHRHSAVMQPV